MAELEHSDSNGVREQEEKEQEEEEEVALSPMPETVEQVAELLERVEKFSPVLPDCVTERILEGAGFHSRDTQVTRLVSLVAQKFLSDVAYEALQHCKMRGGGKDVKKVSSRDRKFALTSEDLLVALADQGITVRKPPFYSN